MFRSKNLNIHVCVKTLVIISLQPVSHDTTFASIKIMMICHKSTHSQHTKHVLSGCKLEEKERKIKNYQEKGRKCGMLAHMQAMFGDVVHFIVSSTCWRLQPFNLILASFCFGGLTLLNLFQIFVFPSDNLGEFAYF